MVACSRSRKLGRSRPIKEPEPLDWPPCFDEDGSAFVFDARSGMFFEARSEFFYDPKSKMYYCNRKKMYYRYDDTKEPPFVEVHPGG